MAYELKEKNYRAEVVNLHPAMRAFTDLFIVSNTAQKLRSQLTTNNTCTHSFTRKMIVRAPERYSSIVVPRVDKGVFFFFDFCGETSAHVEKGRKCFKIIQANGLSVKELLMVQNVLLRITRSSHSLSTAYLHLLHSGRFMDELFKRGERLKLPVAIKNGCRQKLPDCLHLMILEADLRLLVLKVGKLFDESY